MAPGKSSLHSNCEGDSGIALESRQGNQASRHIEGGISRSFSRCGRKPWVPWTCDGDLRKLLRVPIKAISPSPGPLLPSGDKGDVVQDVKSLSGGRTSVELQPS